MAHLIELSPEIRGVFKGLGRKEDEVALTALTAGLKDLLRMCEADILEFEIKYGISFERFKEELESGRLGDPHSYPLEKDAMVWEDLENEKKIRLQSLRQMERLC